jgi:hypothetical protein
MVDPKRIDEFNVSIFIQAFEMKIRGNKLAEEMSNKIAMELFDFNKE